MPLYESTFIARQDISAQDVEKLTETFCKIITDNGGKIVKTENWGLRSLAYIVKKNRKGHYVMLGLDCPFPALKEMERKIKLNENILRNITFKVDELNTENSVMISGKYGGSDEENDLPVIEEIETE